VVLTLLYIPFGKLFHVVQRPASLGVQVAKAAALEHGGGPAVCGRCGQPFETEQFVADLRDTMGELGLGFAGGSGLCPRCKRVSRGTAYLEHVKGGFR
jgi:hypothetical protein